MPSTKELAKTYLDTVKPAKEAAEAFRNKVYGWDSDTTNEQMVKDAAPVIAAWQKADNDLLRVKWPAAIAADVKAMVRADAAVIDDLGALEGAREVVTDDLASKWFYHYLSDEGMATVKANKIRADFDIPPTIH
jgi:hypothetical protein